ncbi:MAG: hypothetical protein EOM21_19150 [Gammaproteobacteria bacterium]|nr:hypothetical protein [Gammaproteobacteria bacterium]
MSEQDFSKLSKKELVELLNAANASAQVMPGMMDSTESYSDELEKIDKLASVANPHQIPFRETSDHKNVMLYTAINKRVGPLHPDNARRTMIRWKKAGVQLFTAPRTEAQIEAFKQTPEYKAHIIKHEATRKQRRAQSSKGKTEAMMKEVAAMTAAAVAGARNG